MRTIDGKKAVDNLRSNAFASWNRSASSTERSQHPTDASARIYEQFATLQPYYTGPRMGRDDPLFAMGSCFAREIEGRLVELGARVVSLDDRVRRPEFMDADGKLRTGFFHRFTPRSMLQEFQRCFDEIPGWTEESLLFRTKSGKVLDFNFTSLLRVDNSLDAVLTRRGVARELVRSAAEARMIVLTLGLTEAWFHLPSGLYANAPDPEALARRSEEFELHVLDCADTVECLEGILDLLERRHRTGDFQMIVTVSPVPMTSTFTRQDVIVANMESKSALRAAAGLFAAAHDKVHYFPSYEMALYSPAELVWQADRLHVTYKIVKKIVSSFTKYCYEPGALQSPAAAQDETADAQ